MVRNSVELELLPSLFCKEIAPETAKPDHSSIAMAVKFIPNLSSLAHFCAHAEGALGTGNLGWRNRDARATKHAAQTY